MISEAAAADPSETSAPVLPTPSELVAALTFLGKPTISESAAADIIRSNPDESIRAVAAHKSHSTFSIGETSTNTGFVASTSTSTNTGIVAPTSTSTTTQGSAVQNPHPEEVHGGKNSDRMVENSSVVALLSRIIAEKDARINALIAEKDARIAEKDAHINALIAGKDAHINDLIAAKDAHINALIAHIVEKDDAIAERNTIIAARDIRISILTAALKHARAQGMISRSHASSYQSFDITIVGHLEPEEKLVQVLPALPAFRSFPDTLSEAEFTEVAFQALEQLFSNRTMELKVCNTSNENWLSGQNPDITIAAHPMHSCNAMNAAVIVELKKPSVRTFNASHKRQVVSYGLSILKSDPRRPHVFCVLWNGHMVQVFEICQTICFEYALCSSSVVNDNGSVNGSHPLVILAGMSLASLGVKAVPDLGQGMVLTHFLGSGATADVYAVKSAGQELVVKSFRNDPYNYLLERETNKLAVLRGVAGVPQVVHRENGNIVLSPRGNPVTELSATFFCELVDTLKATHDRGLCHRDIREPNILMVDKKPLLVDWGFAAPLGRRCVFEGGLQTASNEILYALKDQSQSKPLHTPTRADDLVSLVRFAMLAMFPGMRKNLRNQSASDDFQSLISFWEQNSALWSRLTDCARNTDYDGLKVAARDVIPDHTYS